MDTPTLDKLLKDLHTVLGFGVHLYDKKCRGIAHYTSESGFCRLIHTVSKTVTLCQRFDDQCFRIAAETGDIYTTLCPFGIYNSVCPIRKGDTLLGFLMLSRTIADTDAAHDAAVQAGLRFLPQEKDSLYSAVKALPQRTQTQLDAYSSILRSTCQYIELHDLFPATSLTLGALAKCYIQQNLQSRLTLQDISDHLHYSRSTLTAAFRREFGITIVTYINKTRLKMGAKLLKDSALSVYDIAQECGFSSAEYFSNLFKKEYGCSPMIYRQRNKKAEA